MSNFDIGRVTSVRSIIPTATLSADLFETDTVASVDVLAWLEDNTGVPIGVRIGGDPYTLTYDAQVGQGSISPAAIRDYAAGTVVVPSGTSVPAFYAEVLPIGYRELDSPGTIMVRIPSKDKPGIDLGTRPAGQGELISWSDDGEATGGWNQFSDAPADDTSATDEPGDLEYEDSYKEPDISSDYISEGQDGEDPGPIDGQDPGDFGGGGDVTLLPGKTYIYYTIDDIAADSPAQAFIPEAISGTITRFRADSRDSGGDQDGATINLRKVGSGVLGTAEVGAGWEDINEVVDGGDFISIDVDDDATLEGLVICTVEIEPPA